MRRILVLAHTGRSDALRAAFDTCVSLRDAGLVPVMREEEFANLQEAMPALVPEVQILGTDAELADLDVAMVLGGDGTVLRSAELVRGSNVPLLGVNLGHVGFLAESERSDLRETVQCVVDRKYTVEERMALDVVVWHGNRHVATTWALNEAAVEKADRERMLEVVAEVDARPISTFGCDGIVMATPTGSTAYAFSAGGPVVWPEVEALIMAPISAHALFVRPLVAAPSSTLAVEVLSRTDAHGVLWCDGRRTITLLPGSRVEVTRSTVPVKLARVNQTPFSERLVKKFELPTNGWRGPVEHPEQGPTTSALPIVASGIEVVEPRNLAPRPETEGHP
ncbi:NAD kinase [Zhihengliuella flava]|uniref:NAD kinase n=1 Tax=Zhihengliuella flava TaxID=1285193 RepID=A0A931DAA7_9MICC|nr:NAD kinase [Zhihengliuella flava]MBG6083726.1 NAD+ kinase [Zhihengliuella flava]